MTRSTAFDDIGPAAPSRVELAGRIRRAREFLNMAEERLKEGENASAERWLDRAATSVRPDEDEA